MPDKKLTDNEIVKELERYSDVSDSDITTTCFKTRLLKEIYLFINRLQAENERLDKEVDRLSQVVLYNDGVTEMKVEEAKAEAYKEFAERLHEELRMYGIKDKFNKAVFLNVVDNAKKELVGEDNG